MNNDNVAIHSNRLEIASYGLSVPKTVKKNKTKVKAMVSKRKEPDAQVSEQIKTLQPKESVIDSKVNVKGKSEVKRMNKKTNVVKKRVVKTKAVQRKQRKGKSLLTAFRINKMERRMVLNLDRSDFSNRYHF